MPLQMAERWMFIGQLTAVGVLWFLPGSAAGRRTPSEQSRDHSVRSADGYPLIVDTANVEEC